MSGLFISGGQSIGASALASVLPVNISFRIDGFDLLAVQGTLKSLLLEDQLIFISSPLFKWSAAQMLFTVWVKILTVPLSS